MVMVFCRMRSVLRLLLLLMMLMMMLRWRIVVVVRRIHFTSITRSWIAIVSSGVTIGTGLMVIRPLVRVEIVSTRSLVEVRTVGIVAIEGVGTPTRVLIGNMRGRGLGLLERTIVFRLGYRSCRRSCRSGQGPLSLNACLIGPPLRDLSLVHCPLLLFLFLIWSTLLRASITPHFSQQPGNVRVTHIGVLLFHFLATRLRVLQEGRHRALGG
mmetsp:Transcript_37519/g.82144  ORF Transcript_37519/g.82144 Transcript_37519/m.82144 type:complete len:212 (+) Transcript_37519:7272-7907(+)